MYDLTVMMKMTVTKVVGRDETGVGNGRLPGFGNAPES